MGEELAASWEGRPCPKCAYVRTTADKNPAWQCPRCQVAYAKYQAGAAIRARFAADGREMAAQARSDSSVLVLIAANLVALAVAYATGMGLRSLMLIYWIQSVIIGLCTVARILNLASFSTENFKIDDQPVEATAATKRRVAFFFLIHYGIFHAAYLAFVAVDSHRGGGLGSPAGYVICALVFAANHGYSLMHNLRRDAQGRPNIGTLMFLPYARILPMHLTILAGGAFFGGTLAFFLFGFLKTLADAVMHVVEHYFLGKTPPVSLGIGGSD